MKKVYEKPMAEKIEFDYKNQIVASGNQCEYKIVEEFGHGCSNRYTDQV